MSRPLVATLVAFLVAMIGPSAARADEERQQHARTLNDEGNAAFDLGNYDEATEKFTDAYKTYPDPRILYNLAQSHRKKKDYERALDVYRNYLRNLPDAPNRKIVEELMTEIEALIAKQKATDARPPQGTTSTGPQLPPIVTRIEEPRPWYANSAGWWLVGGGVLAAGAGVALFVSAASLEDQLATTPDPEIPGIRSEIRTRRTLGTIASVAGGLAIAGGIVVFILSPRTVTREIVPIKDLKLSLSPNWIGVSGRF